MSNRRDVLLRLGATFGVTIAVAHSIFAVNRRHDEIFRDDDAGVGAPVAGLETSAAPRCTAGTLTAAQIEGPFYTPRSPHRRDIRDFGVAEPALVLHGRVLDSQCRPIPGAILDFWQTGHDAIYDQHGYRYRGHQYADSAGRFELVTVAPRAYTAMSSFRTPHIHVKVQGRSTALLTTQLYLPDAEETNARDLMYDSSLAVAYAGGDGSGRYAVFDFVLGDA